jgi:hypothetical protein
MMTGAPRRHHGLRIPQRVGDVPVLAERAAEVAAEHAEAEGVAAREEVVERLPLKGGSQATLET